MDYFMIVAGIIFSIMAIYLIIGVVMSLTYKKEIKKIYETDAEWNLHHGLTEIYIFVSFFWPMVDWERMRVVRRTSNGKGPIPLTPFAQWAGSNSFGLDDKGRILWGKDVISSHRLAKRMREAGLEVESIYLADIQQWVVRERKDEPPRSA